MMDKSPVLRGDKLTCGQCGHDNPTSRINCEKCGTFLSLMPAGTQPQHKLVQGRVRDTQPEPQLTVMTHILCGWPLVLVLIGGAIGGALGGAAYAVNVVAYKARLPVIVKVVLNLLAGFLAIGIWVAIRMALAG